MPRRRSPIDGHLADLPEPQRTTLTTVRERLAKLLPAAEETLSYGVPAFTARGVALIGFGSAARHVSLYPHSSTVVAAIAPHLPAGVDTTRGAIRSPVDRPLPVALLRRIVRLHLDELRAVTDGRLLDVRDDGSVRSEGRMRGGVPVGAWRWFRRDGSLMREGAFRAGVPSGVWRTHAADGALVSEGPHPDERARR